MSDQEIGKKEVERMELELFLEAYECVTGEALILVAAGENPDFICERPNAEEVGIELAKITRDLNDIFWEKVFDRKEHMDIYEVKEDIHHLIERKEKARVSRYANRVKETILVLQLIDGTLDGIKSGFEGIPIDFVGQGFCEIWLADYSGVEPYGDIELFGLYPERWWGHHQRPWPSRKPYG